MDYTIALKLVLAALLGGCIGIEREMREKPAGLRTNMLICVGTTLFMMISMRIGGLYGDYTRIAAQIVTGIGFLGAGAVLHSHGFVLGLTTAATIWVVAGVGMAIGAGFYGTAVLATALTIVTLTIMGYFEGRLQGQRIFSFALRLTDIASGMAALTDVLQQMGLSIPAFNFRKNEHEHRLWFSMKVSREINRQILQRLSQRPEILQVENAMSAEDFVNPLRSHNE